MNHDEKEHDTNDDADFDACTCYDGRDLYCPVHGTFARRAALRANREAEDGELYVGGRAPYSRGRGSVPPGPGGG